MTPAGNAYYAKYGVQTKFYFMLDVFAVTSQPYAGVDVVGADSHIYKDGGVIAATTNAVDTSKSPLFSITLTAAEMQATDIVVYIADASSTVYSWKSLNIKTALQVGTVDIDASQLTNTPAFKATGVGTGEGMLLTGGTSGHGLKGLGGATIGNGIEGRATAASYAGIAGFGFGNGHGVSLLGGTTGNGFQAQGGATSGHGMEVLANGTGHGLYALGGLILGNGIQGQAQGGPSQGGIVGLGFGTGAGMSLGGGVTGNGIFATGGATSGAGISAQGTGGSVGLQGTGARPSNILSGETLEDITGPPAPGVTTVAQSIGALIARFYYLVTQTTTQQKQYKSDSATLVGTSTVSDDGVTQTKGKSA